MRTKQILIYVGIALLLTITFTVLMSDLKTVPTTSSDVIDNKKLSWGLKFTKIGERPSIGKSQTDLLDEYGGIYFGRNEKVIYLTFDSGYEAGYTEKILDILKDNNVKATFFITANYLNKSEDLVKRMIDEGHIIGNHTVNHPSMPDIKDDEELKKEIMDLHSALYNKTGYEMKFIRPPKGEFSRKTLALSNSLGYKTVLWSFAYEDWKDDKQKNLDDVKKIILERLHQGEVMLFHSKSENNMLMLDSIIKEIKRKGYEFKNLDEFPT